MKNFIFVKNGQKLIKIDFPNIYGIEAKGDYCAIRCLDGKVHIIHATLAEMENKLPVADFHRCHRSFIVNVDVIREIEGGRVMIAEDVVPIGQQYKKELLRKINYIRSTQEEQEESQVSSEVLGAGC